MEKFYSWLFSSAKIWLLIYPQRTKKSLQLPVLIEMPWIQLFCTGGKTRSSSSWGGVYELILPHDARNNVKCLR